MNPLPLGAPARLQFDTSAKFPALPTHLRSLTAIDAALGRKVAEGLQLLRASTIALTRLQLALAGGDRSQAMAAIDRLHVIDGQIEHLVEELPQPSESGPETDGASADRESPREEDLLTSLNRHLADQKLALTFEKLALASGISGPTLVSADPPLAEGNTPRPLAGSSGPEDRDERGAHAAGSEPSTADWHAHCEVQTIVWDRLPAQVWGVLLAVMAAVALVAAVATMTML